MNVNPLFYNIYKVKTGSSVAFVVKYFNFSAHKYNTLIQFQNDI